jgi:ribosome modulation factor
VSAQAATGAPIFISYSGDDTTIAEKVCRELELDGIDCWIAPRNVEPGRDYGEQIIAAIESAPAMVLIHSAGANASLFVPNELERAVSKGKPVFVLRRSQVQPSWDIGRLAARSQWFDGWTPPLEDRVYTLAAAIRRQLGMPPLARRTARPGVAPLSRRPSTTVGLAAAGLAALAVVALVGSLLFFTSQSPTPTPSPAPRTAVASASILPTESPIPQATGEPGFYLTEAMGVARGRQIEALLQDGSVLIAGGTDGSSALRSAELYDPTTGGFSPTTGSMSAGRECPAATPLPDGRVLIAGGWDGSASLASAELYDPKTGKFARTPGSMAVGRECPIATPLPDGRVLIAGGWDGSATLASAELYDPKTGKFTRTAGPMRHSREFFTTALLPNGDVLIAGGDDAVAALSTAELYDPKSGTFSLTGSMTTARSAHTATLLSDGRVLLAGGRSNMSGPVLKTAELYDPKSGTFSPTTGSMTDAREGHTATLLRDGRVLVAGGLDDSATLATAEIYIPATGSFSPAGTMKVARFSQTATLLPNGRVLIVGGQDHQVSTASAELYQP